jgi:glutamate racemase
MSSAPSILVFDSGLGGLTVHAEIIKALPFARMIYVADDAAFPYGRLSAEVCAQRVADVMAVALERFQPDIAVIACNTASTVALPALRARFATPFVGTVPAVKPAAAQSRSKMISILGTPGTVSREYTHDLIIQHAADCRVALVGAPNLARLAEAYLRGEPVSDAEVLAEIAPCFKEKDGALTDTVALACTHYPLLLDVYRRIAPWDVAWIDPAPAIARRVVQLLGDRAAVAARSESPEGVACFTSGALLSATLSDVLKGRALAPQALVTLPFTPPAA